MSKRTSPSSFESALESTKHAKSESSVAISLPSKAPLTDSPNIETPCTVSTIIEFLDTDSEVNDVLAPPLSCDFDPKLEISIAETLSSRMSASAAIASDECKFPAKFVTVMKFLAVKYQYFLVNEYEDAFDEQLSGTDEYATIEYFSDLFNYGDYDHGKVLDALGPDGTKEQRKALLRSFLVVDEQTTCTVNDVFSSFAQKFLDDEDGWLEEWLRFAPDGHCVDEYTALCKSYLEGKGPSLRELFVA